MTEEGSKQPFVGQPIRKFGQQANDATHGAISHVGSNLPPAFENAVRQEEGLQQHLLVFLRIAFGGKGFDIRWKNGSETILINNLCRESFCAISTDDPKFVNPKFGDFFGADLHLRFDSPAIGFADANYAPLFDLDDLLRDDKPDLGAYEFFP